LKPDGTNRHFRGQVAADSTEKLNVEIL
jgi:hypothetical protein